MFEGFRDRQGADKKGSHAAHEQKPPGRGNGRNLIGQPRIPAVHPVHHSEDSYSLDHSNKGCVVLDQRSELCDRKNEDKAEEQFQG